MLDDLKLIHERDVQDALGVVAGQWRQLRLPLEVQGRRSFKHVYNVVYAAMGGSALAASMAAVWPKIGEPLEIIRDYDLPEYVDGDTLVILSSYSGDTEETLSALAQAEEKGAQIAIITAGGALRDIAIEKGYLLVALPETRFARAGVFSNFVALLEILITAGLLKQEDITSELHGVAALLKAETATWLPDVPASNNQAKRLAQELIGKSVVIYSGPKLFPAAYKWKLGLNENAKQIAWANQLPECSHNELTGWSGQPMDKPYAVIDLRGSFEHPRIKKRFEATARLLSGMRPEPIVVEPKGETVLAQLAWSMTLGDFVSLYVAVLNGSNPASLELVDKLKTTLAR